MCDRQMHHILLHQWQHADEGTEYRATQEGTLSLNVHCAMIEFVGVTPRNELVAKLAAGSRVNLAESSTRSAPSARRRKRNVATPRFNRACDKSA